MIIFFYYNIFDNSLGCYTENGKTILKPGMINLSVCEKSINKLGAYDFLDFVFDYNNYNEISKNMCQGFPTLKANEEDWKQVLTASETFTNRYGDIVEPFDFEMGVDGYVCTIPPVSIEEYSLAEAFIKSAEYIEPMPDKYMDIILEEAELYFEDKKSLDDTVKAIENRVTNALNE